jgi:26S proteasome regulatory subunit T5
MASLEDLDDLERENKDDKKDEGDKDKKLGENGDAEMKEAEKPEEEEDIVDDEILSLSTRDIIARRRLLENDARIMKSEFQRLTHEKQAMHEKIKDNVDKIENNRCVHRRPPSRRAELRGLRQTMVPHGHLVANI